MKCPAPSTHLIIHIRLETIVSTPDHPLVSPAISPTDERLRTRLANLVAALHIGYYLSVNANCFCVNFSVERNSTLPASWISTINTKDNLGGAVAILGERDVR